MVIKIELDTLLGYNLAEAKKFSLNHPIVVTFANIESCQLILDVCKLLIENMAPTSPSSALTIESLFEMFNMEDVSSDLEYKKTVQLLSKFYPTLTKNAACYYREYAWPYETKQVQDYITKGLRCEKSSDAIGAFKMYYQFLLNYKQTRLLVKPCQLFLLWLLIYEHGTVESETMSFTSIMINVIATQIKIWLAQQFDDAFILYTTKFLIPRGYDKIKVPSVFKTLNKTEQCARIAKRICKEVGTISYTALSAPIPMENINLQTFSENHLPYMNRVIDACQKNDWGTLFADYDMEFYYGTAFCAYYATKPRLFVLLHYYNHRISELIKRLNQYSGGVDVELKPTVKILFNGLLRFIDTCMQTSVLDENIASAILSKEYVDHLRGLGAKLSKLRIIDALNE